MTDEPLHPEELQRGASDPVASVWVAASAGTGKTKVLTDRVLRLMLGGTSPTRILCLTFTKAAAAEMSNRIARTLGRWSTASDDKLDAALAALMGRVAETDERRRARRLFAEVLDAPGGLHIQTIHSFCQALLGRFPIESGTAPHFSVVDDRDANEMLSAAQRAVLTRSRNEAGSAGPLATALTRITAHTNEQGFADIVATLASERGRIRRFIDGSGGLVGAAAKIRGFLGLAAADTSERIVADACGEDSFDGAALRSLLPVMESGKKTDQDNARVLGTWLAATANDRAATFFDYAKVFLTASSKLPEQRKRLCTAAVATARPDASDILVREASRLRDVELRRRSAVVAEATEGLLVIGDALLAAYESAKSASAKLDYDDLILRTLSLLTQPEVAAWVLFKLDGGIDHILVDEAQDTNPDQWKIVETLAGEFFVGEGARDQVRTVFAVGDVKQSIYSFQRADPEAFRTMRDVFAERAPAAGRAWRQVALDVSFRSTSAVLDAVDAVFGAPGVADGVNLDGVPIRHRAWRQGDGGIVEVWPAVTPREIDAPAPWKPPVERIPGDSPQSRLARLAARRIAAWISDREILESKGRPIRAGDVMILVRRRTGFVVDLVRALKETGIPVAGVDRMVLTEQLAVMDLMAIGRFLLLPEDDLTLATVLKGPLFGFDDDDLFKLAYRRERSLWAVLRSYGHDPAYGGAADILGDLLSRTDYDTPFALFSHILGPLRGREKILARLGPDAEDPLGVFLDLALSYEHSHVPTLQGFLQWMETGDVEVKRDLEQDTGDYVRILTVHGAKGLQAPIVILPDTLQTPRAGGGLLWPRNDDGDEIMLWPPRAAFVEKRADAEAERIRQAQDQEYRRLLYVAMTRAEDRLYVGGWHTRRAAPEGCWYNLVRDGLSMFAATFEDPFLAAAPEVDDARVLRLHRPQGRPVEAAEPSRVDSEAQPLPDWARRPAPEEPDPPRPLAPSRPAEIEPTVVSPLGEDDGVRFKRGLLVHRMLQTLPALPPERRRAAAESYLSRPLHGLDRDRIRDLVNETMAVLGVPEFSGLFGPESLAEVPIVGIVDGRVLSGRIDRLLFRDNEILIVDYKTNRPPPRSPSGIPKLYRDQMAAYRSALRTMYPGRKVRCLLLWTDGPSLMELAENGADSSLA